MQNIIENNKIIAEFLGYINTTPSDKVFSIYENNANPFLGKTLLEPMSMKFHSDWNWLMQVVEKIENLSKEGETYMLSITKFSARVTYKGSRIVDLPIDNTKIEAVYNACVEFIKWYNENR